MPPVSQAQRRWAFYQAEHGTTVKQRAVGREFEGPGIKGLPKRITKAHDPGREPLPVEHTSKHH